MKKERFHNIQPEIEEAFLNHQFKKAEELAFEYLHLAENKKVDWNYGNAIHHANLMLGKVALKNGNQEEAKQYLLKAGKSKGSPQLKSFGPNMLLAKELLELGEKKTVIEYIDLTKKFWMWIVSWRKIRKWKREIRKGNIPDFGANLEY